MLHHGRKLAAGTPVASGSRGVYALVEKLQVRHAVAFVVLSFGAGQFANRYTPLNHFLLYQLLFIPAIVIAFTEVKVFIGRMAKYKSIVASHPSRDTGIYIAELLRSRWAVAGVLAVGSLYIYATVSLKYIALNLTGYYALAMISLVMVSAMLGQTCYVYYLLLLRRVVLSEKLSYNFYFPARTEWVQLLINTGTRLSNAFFVLGFIYTLVYFLNMPSAYVAISLHPWHVALTTPNNVAFVAGWATIFVIIVLAFPLYAWLKDTYVRRLIRRLKDISIGEIELLVAKSNLRIKGDVDAELKYYQLMASIENASIEASVLSDRLAVALTISSIAVHLFKISESFVP
jgi:hypothetical protein